jgi:hypothetical protein
MLPSTCTFSWTSYICRLLETTCGRLQEAIESSKRQMTASATKSSPFSRNYRRRLETPGVYRRLQKVTKSYVTECYGTKVTLCYNRLHEVTADYRRLQQVTANYARLQYVTAALWATVRYSRLCVRLH